jgi:nucleoid-associated protein YgaU
LFFIARLVCVYCLRFQVTCTPDVSTRRLSPSDEFLVLACDGVWDCVGDQECVDYLRARMLGVVGTTATTDSELTVGIAREEGGRAAAAAAAVGVGGRRDNPVAEAVAQPAGSVAPWPMAAPEAFEAFAEAAAEVDATSGAGAGCAEAAAEPSDGWPPLGGGGGRRLVDPAPAVAALLAHCLAAQHPSQAPGDAKGTDNMTCLVVVFGTPELST